MAVPDWPTSYGYNMFALPVSTWFTGGVFHEHTHRLWASVVGVLVVALTRWLGGRAARVPLLSIGGAEILAGLALLKLGADWRGAGHFLAGIGGVVLLAGVVWVKNSPAAKPLPALGWWAFGLVQFQGLLGGLRVVLDAHVVAGAKLGMVFGLVHGCLGQGFLALLCVIVLLTSRGWNSHTPHPVARTTSLFRLALFTTVLIFLQLILGAAMRHQHAGLAIPDFPLAYGKLWPDTSAAAVAGYNAQRVEIAGENAITAPQIWLQMAHRGMAVLILAAVTLCAWRGRNSGFSAIRRLATVWLGLILIQVGLGAWTIWSNKAADIATAHVVTGALSLVTGVFLTIIAARFAGRDGVSPYQN
jgi:cytochrome c oxidase assembly protein subunit 15